MIIVKVETKKFGVFYQFKPDKKVKIMVWIKSKFQNIYSYRIYFISSHVTWYLLGTSETKGKGNGRVEIRVEFH